MFMSTKDLTPFRAEEGWETDHSVNVRDLGDVSILELIEYSLRAIDTESCGQRLETELSVDIFLLLCIGEVRPVDSLVYLAPNMESHGNWHLPGSALVGGTIPGDTGLGKQGGREHNDRLQRKAAGGLRSHLERMIFLVITTSTTKEQ